MYEFVDRKISGATDPAITGAETQHGEACEHNEKAGVGGNTFHGKSYNWENLLFRGNPSGFRVLRR